MLLALFHFRVEKADCRSRDTDRRGVLRARISAGKDVTLFVGITSESSLFLASVCFARGSGARGPSYSGALLDLHRRRQIHVLAQIQ